ncbi:hypothetical protein HUJ04_005512 [Dendroctonus ponderosae]|nr:hypothetical protein HUJ04_005512 [Dendroctonus ponderosae]
MEKAVVSPAARIKSVTILASSLAVIWPCSRPSRPSLLSRDSTRAVAALRAVVAAASNFFHLKPMTPFGGQTGGNQRHLRTGLKHRVNAGRQQANLVLQPTSRLAILIRPNQHRDNHLERPMVEQLPDGRPAKVPDLDPLLKGRPWGALIRRGANLRHQSVNGRLTALLQPLLVALQQRRVQDTPKVQPFHPIHEKQPSGGVVQLVVHGPSFRQEVLRVLAWNHPLERA